MYFFCHVRFDEEIFPFTQLFLGGYLKPSMKIDECVTPVEPIKPTHHGLYLPPSLVPISQTTLPLASTMPGSLVPRTTSDSSSPVIPTLHVIPTSPTSDVIPSQLIFSHTSLPESYSNPVNEVSTALHPMVTRLRDGTRKPKKHFTCLTSKHTLSTYFQSVVSSPVNEPTCYSEASNYPQWRNAMLEEFNALLRQKTWSLVPASQAQNVVGCKWVYKIKKKADGSIERYKAWLVEKWV